MNCKSNIYAYKGIGFFGIREISMATNDAFFDCRGKMFAARDAANHREFLPVQSPESRLPARMCF